MAFFKQSNLTSFFTKTSPSDPSPPWTSVKKSLTPSESMIKGLDESKFYVVPNKDGKVIDFRQVKYKRPADLDPKYGWNASAGRSYLLGTLNCVPYERTNDGKTCVDCKLTFDTIVEFAMHVIAKHDKLCPIDNCGFQPQCSGGKWAWTVHLNSHSKPEHHLSESEMFALFGKSPCKRNTRSKESTTKNNKYSNEYAKAVRKVHPGRATATNKKNKAASKVKAAFLENHPELLTKNKKSKST